MPPASLPRRSGDRADDPRTHAGNLVKPPILTRAAQRWLCIACLLTIVHGTLGPIGPRHGLWLRPTAAWRWLPEQRPSDLNDVVTNLAVYVPVGVAFRLLLRRRGRAGWSNLLWAWGASVLLSYVTELLQQFMPARSSSLTDVYVNSVAALGGALVAVPFQRLLRHLHGVVFVRVRDRRQVWSVASRLALGSTFVLMTMPWGLRRPTMILGLDRPLALGDPWCFGRFAAFAGLGFLAAGEGRALGYDRRRALRRAVVGMAAFATLLELVQAALAGHVSSLAQALIATAGGAAGALLAVTLFHAAAPGLAPEQGELRPATSDAPPRSSPPRRWPLTILLGTLLCVMLWSLVADVRHGALRHEPLFDWIPFRAHFRVSFAVMLADLFQQCGLYAFITFVCLSLTQGRRPLLALFLLGTLAAVVEVGHAYLKDHGADTTAPLLVLASWFATRRVWNAVYPLGRARPAAPPPSGDGPALPIRLES